VAQKAFLAGLAELFKLNDVSVEIKPIGIHRPHGAPRLLPKGPVLLACAVPAWVPINLTPGPRGGRPYSPRSYAAPTLRTAIGFADTSGATTDITGGATTDITGGAMVVLVDDARDFDRCSGAW
jgi:hypothetical protein